MRNLCCRQTISRPASVHLASASAETAETDSDDYSAGEAQTGSHGRRRRWWSKHGLGLFSHCAGVDRQTKRRDRVQPSSPLRLSRCARRDYDTNGNDNDTKSLSVTHEIPQIHLRPSCIAPHHVNSPMAFATAMNGAQSSSSSSKQLNDYVRSY